MKQIYQVEGSLPKDFVGQISYTISLEKTYQKLDIGFRFDKQYFTAETLDEETLHKIIDYCRTHYGMELSEDSNPAEAIIKNAKTEIQLLAFLNDEFIGGIHRQMTERHMIFTADEATEGCIPQKSMKGVLKVVIPVFNVLMDDTRYCLWVEGE